MEPYGLDNLSGVHRSVVYAKKEPHGPVAAASVGLHPTDRTPLHKLDPECAVLVSDNETARRQFIHRLIDTCEVRAQWVEEFSEAEQIKGSGCCRIALVALGAGAAFGEPSFEVIRSLNQQGLMVISYGDAIDSWPLSARCRSLIAGSALLLDSGRVEFGQRLRNFLIQHVRLESGRRAEANRVKATMKELGVVGESRAMVAVFGQVLRVSRLSDLPTLITGESGTGKELLARAIHQLDAKARNGPFIAVNCGAISSGLAESELFGHRRGAFTGADRDRKGLIRAAEGGVVFLDEIGELDDTLQVKLLRVLQERRVLGVGEDQEAPVSVRVIAATNRNLSAAVQYGKFRADLFHRLNVLSIHIPPTVTHSCPRRKFKSNSFSRCALWKLSLFFVNLPALRRTAAPPATTINQSARSSIGQSTRLRIWGLGVQIPPGAP